MKNWESLLGQFLSNIPAIAMALLAAIAASTAGFLWRLGASLRRPEFVPFFSPTRSLDRVPLQTSRTGAHLAPEMPRALWCDRPADGMETRMEHQAPKMVTEEIERKLAAGRPVGAELTAHRPGHRRLLFVYSVGASNRGSTRIMQFNVKRYEATIEIIEEGQNNSSTFFDLEWASADSLDTLEEAILKLAGAPVTLTDSYSVYYPRKAK